MPNLAGIWHYPGSPGPPVAVRRTLTRMLELPDLRAGSSAARVSIPASVGTDTLQPNVFDGRFIGLGSVGCERLPESIAPWQNGNSGGRLSPSRHGYVSDERRYWVVGDVRIDNRSELVAGLGLDAGLADALSDQAILLAAWERWQRESLAMIAGAFAFAVWDALERELILARDPAGERPLYYHAASGYFAFASNPRALLHCPEIDSAVDELYLALSLCGLPNEQGRSYLKAVNSVPPGHCVVTRPGAVAQSAYWRLEDVADVRFARDEEYVEAFLEVFDEAVRSRLRNRGKVAAELSGGLDSSSVCATAAGMLGAEGRSLTAFTSVPSVDLSGRYPDRYMPDEGCAAAEVARLYPNIEHKLVKSTDSNLLAELRRTHPSLDRPMANPLNHVWLNVIQEQASAAGARVLLNGQRGNITISTPGMLRDVLGRGRVFSALRLAREHKRSWAPLLKNAFSVTRDALLPRSLRAGLDPRYQAVTLDASPINPQLADELHMLDRFRDFILGPPADFRTAKWRDFNQFEIGDFHLAAQNTWGIDRSDPTSDKRVLAFCLGIPMEQYVVGGVNCSLIRRAMQGRLPESTLRQSRKGLQSADWYESLTPIVPQMIAELTRIERSSLAQRILNLPRLRETLERWPANAADAALEEPRCNSALTRGLACGYFLREFEGVA